ncbi:hypothetical protein VYU27_010625, partial [Nannochloropsis oceanica]
RVNCLCFDKTGTLTEDGLTLDGVQVVENGLLGQPLDRPEHLYIRHFQTQPKSSSSSSKPHRGGKPAATAATAAVATPTEGPLYTPAILVSLVMAACHSVSRLDEEDEALNSSTANLSNTATAAVLHDPDGAKRGSVVASLPILGDVLPLGRRSSRSLDSLEN